MGELKRVADLTALKKVPELSLEEQKVWRAEEVHLVERLMLMWNQAAVMYGEDSNEDLKMGKWGTNRKKYNDDILHAVNLTKDSAGFTEQADVEEQPKIGLTKSIKNLIGNDDDDDDDDDDE